MKEERIHSALPRHIAIIPDGNRRWAKERGKAPWEGHEVGAENTEALIRKAHDLGVYCLSFWGSSLDNLEKRSLSERRALLGIYERYFKKLLSAKEIHENKVCVKIIGRWEEQLPSSLTKILHECVAHTRKYRDHLLNFFLAYNGDDDMVRAMGKIAEKYSDAAHVTADVVKENLMTKDLPSVDFLIRTGGEPHLSSGFLMWDSANAQLYFSQKYFPDFGPEAFVDALDDYARRTRRFGR